MPLTPPRTRSADALVSAYAAWVIRRRRLVIAVMLAIALVAGAGVQFLGFSTDYRVYFGAQNPQLTAYIANQNVYAKEDNILLVVVPQSGNVFTPAVLTALRDLTAAGWKAPYATRVDSIANFQHSAADGDDIEVRRLVARTGPVTPAAASEVRRIAMNEPLLVDRLVSADGSAAGVNINLSLPQRSADEVPRAMAHARRLVAEFEAKHPDIRVAVTGVVALNHAFVEASLSDLSSLVPLMYLVVVLGVVVFLRSLAGTIATLAVVALSAATAMGAAGWMGYLINPASAAAPVIITTVAIADSIHILVTTFREMRRGATLHAAITEGLRINFHPVFLTSLTTAIGFLSLNASDAPPFRDLGNITAIGVAAAWLFAVALLPALLAVLGAKPGRAAEGEVSAMDRLAGFVIARRRGLLWGMIALSIGLAAGIPRIELNDQFVNYFAPSIRFRADTDFAAKKLSGMYTMEFSLESGGAGGIAAPAYLETLEAFAGWLRARPLVAHVHTLSDVLKRLNRNMHGDDPAYHRLPGKRDLAAQYLLMFEMSLPYGLDLRNQINLDRSATRVVVTLRNLTTRQARRLKADAEQWLAHNMPTAGAAQATGPLVMFAYISERNIRSMLTGTGLALVLISLCLMAALRNFRLGLVSIVPNATPALVAFGIWGFTVAEAGLSASVVAAVTLGIIVDNTVHFLAKYQRARRDDGASAPDAVRYAFSTVGTALWVTSAILVAGFAILALSAFQLNQTMGLLTVLVVIVALLTDFLLLPSLLIAIDTEKKRETQALPAGVADR